MFQQTRKNGSVSDPEFIKKIASYESKLDEYGKNVRSEFSNNRNEYSDNFQKLRNELGEHFARFISSTEDKINIFQTSTLSNLKDNRDELSKSLSSFEKKSAENANLLVKATSDSLKEIRTEVDNKLTSLQKDNNEKLEKMRLTVDEKLHDTLEKRLGESFKLVSAQLESVQKGLGEMQTIASGVGDLKKVLSNVKTKGVIGEYQLSGLLEQLLAPGQYEKNVKTKNGSRETVEFAIKIPDKNVDEEFIWLPVDAKFPTEDYERLQNAYDIGDKTQIEIEIKNLSVKIDKFAKDIHVKYVEPPYTTDFAIMFLPFEGLYAEVLRIPGLHERIQKNYKVTITGPTTLSALLNSLQMGFRTLAIQSRSVEVWQILSAVKTEFGKFGDILDRAKKKLDEAQKELESTGTRTRKITTKLKAIESMPETETEKLLGIGSDLGDQDE